MPKERNFNPAQAQRKLDKQKSLKKAKAEAQARRNEKLARRNPERIERQINDLKALEETGQKLRPREQELLEALQRDLRTVQKAREALGDKAPKFESFQSRRGGFGGRGRGDGVLGKRRRDEHGHFGQDSESSETDEEVRRIPMPRDTPPPIPRQYQKKRDGEADTGPRGHHGLPTKPPVVESRTVYEAQPEIKDLRQEAVKKFIPAAVRVKQDAIRGQGKLLEPEEMDKLEQAGYNAGPAGREDQGDDDDTQQRLLEEEQRFNQELRSVQIEEVEDEEA
ncbi:WW domain binding protein 11-domain-containing protein [Aspergillus avenaceus]|uniref:WW domain binding protein 11-domain-containing protein n=1 Tax=Aspergillus avenaceus TaxID=36643 RepID=A0A5N6TVB6_ASPAV|nr:WW domain binding protein 11-domain-containing protein [Aspergillus avenaceus]